MKMKIFKRKRKPAQNLPAKSTADVSNFHPNGAIQQANSKWLPGFVFIFNTLTLQFSFFLNMKPLIPMPVHF